MIGGTKRKEFRIRTLSAFLKGVSFEVEIACSEKSNGKRIYLACSLKGASAAVIARTYKLRWRIEIFHKEVKSYLEFEDAAVMKFDALQMAPLQKTAPFNTTKGSHRTKIFKSFVHHFA